jgi:hypothetical protein
MMYHSVLNGTGSISYLVQIDMPFLDTKIERLRTDTCHFENTPHTLNMTTITQPHTLLLLNRDNVGGLWNRSRNLFERKQLECMRQT